MKNRLTLPTVRQGTTTNGAPALLLSVGIRQWPVLISADDLKLVTAATGYTAWGFQCGQVVVGDPDRLGGRMSVAKVIAGISGTTAKAVYRDGNPLNLLRDNIGIRRHAGVFWLRPKAGEADPVHFNGGFQTRIPRAIYQHRDVVRPARDPAQAALSESKKHWTQRGA